jgi:hypothetical protein
MAGTPHSELDAARCRHNEVCVSVQIGGMIVGEGDPVRLTPGQGRHPSTPWMDPAVCKHPREFREVLSVRYPEAFGMGAPPSTKFRCAACGRVWTLVGWAAR